MTDNTHPSNALLRELMKQEEAAWQQAAAAADTGSENERTTKARAWWAACDRLMRQYLKLSSAGPHPRLPTRALLRLSRIAGALATGNVPEPVRHASARDGRRMWPVERMHIAYAVFYIRAVRANRIGDPAPIKTISECYGVSRQAVQGWIKRGDELIEDIAEPPIQTLEDRMRWAGETYSYCGRGIGRASQRRVHEPGAVFDPFIILESSALEDPEAFADLKELLCRRHEILRRRAIKAKATKEREHIKDLEADLDAAWNALMQSDAPEADVGGQS
jgi:hypothetical protein